MLVAVFPALMYFFSVFVMVHFEAKMYGVGGQPRKTRAIDIFKREWFYLMPLVVITVFMLTGFSPAYSAVLGLVTCILISALRTDTRMDLTLALVVISIFIGSLMGFSRMVSALPGVALAAVVAARWRQQSWAGVRRFVEAARVGTENSLRIGATVGVIGIIIGVLTYSGLVLTFADIVIEMADGSLVLTILLIALASLVLGMGVPVTAAYLITAVVAVPALTHLGVNPIAAHMIVYWLSQDSNITPPVCIAAFAGATIAKANMWRTALAAFKFAKFLYLGPFLFGYVPAFSLDGSAWDIVRAFALILLGTFLYSWLFSGIWLRPLVSRVRGIIRRAPST
jgi:TRAP-type uncharacterized transport system fused permease subunit